MEPKIIYKYNKVSRRNTEDPPPHRNSKYEFKYPLKPLSKSYRRIGAKSYDGVDLYL